MQKKVRQDKKLVIEEGFIICCGGWIGFNNFPSSGPCHEQNTEHVVIRMSR